MIDSAEKRKVDYIIKESTIALFVVGMGLILFNVIVNGILSM